MNLLFDLARAAVEGIIAGASATVHDKEKAVQDALASMEKVQNPGAFGDYQNAREEAKARLGITDSNDDSEDE